MISRLSDPNGELKAIMAASMVCNFENDIGDLHEHPPNRLLTDPEIRWQPFEGYNPSGPDTSILIIEQQAMCKSKEINEVK